MVVDAHPARRLRRLQPLRRLPPALLAPYAWGDHHLTDHGRNLVLVGPATGAEIDPVLIDRATGRPWTEAGTVFIAGADIRRRYAAPQPS